MGNTEWEEFNGASKTWLTLGGLGTVDDVVQLTRQVGLGIGLLRVSPDVALDALAKLGDIDAKLLQDRDDDAFLLRQQRVQEVQVVHLRVAIPPGKRERVVQRFGRFYGKAVRINHSDVG